MDPARHPTTPQPASAFDTALTVILGHASVNQCMEVICKLLCTSKAVASAVMQQCGRQVPLQYTASNLQQAQWFAAWLQKRSPIVKALDLAYTADSIGMAELLAQLLAQRGSVFSALQVNVCVPDTSISARAEAAEAGVTAALQHAAAATSSSLTRLKFWTEHSTAHALAALTGLQQLSIKAMESSKEWSVLSSLTRLTYVQVGLLGVDAERYLPAHVQELDLYSDLEDEDENPLALGHITALQKLNTSMYHRISGTTVLPPSLEDLCVGGFSWLGGVEPVLALHALKRLILMTWSEAVPARQLEQISNTLTGLTSLQLTQQLGNTAGCQTEDEAVGIEYELFESCMAAWCKLPLSELHIDFYNGATALCETSLQQLSKLQSLTKLKASMDTKVGFKVGRPFSAVLVPVLPCLTSLHALEWIVLEEDANDLAMQQLAAAVGKVPNLRSMFLLPYWHGSMQLGDSVAHFAAATQLTALGFVDCGVSDFAISSIASSITGLAELRLGGNTHITDAVLPGIGRQLSQLTALHLQGCCAVTDAGVICLSGLRQLQVLDVTGTTVTKAAKRKALSNGCW